MRISLPIERYAELSHLAGPPDEDVRSFGLRLLQSEGKTVMLRWGNLDGRKSDISSWDPVVYVGCVERIATFFFLYDVHWSIEKSELLRRVKEWNEALTLYCDDKGLQGAEREAVISKHTASPLARCANPDCEHWEQDVKELQRCSRLRRVAYCSRDCQRSDWKQHKSICAH